MANWRLQSIMTQIDVTFNYYELTPPGNTDPLTLTAHGARTGEAVSCSVTKLKHLHVDGEAPARR